MLLGENEHALANFVCQLPDDQLGEMTRDSHDDTRCTQDARVRSTT
jgi:hypothetical protein